MLTIDPIFPWPIVAAIVAAGCGHCIISYHRLQQPRRRIWPLLALRLTLWLLFLAVSLRPSSTVLNDTLEKSKLVLLTDHSTSMGTRDTVNRVSRLESVTTALEQHESNLNTLAATFNIERLAFARRNWPENSERGLVSGGTAIGDALDDVRLRNRASKLHSVVLFSDGRNNQGRQPLELAARLARQGVPIHAIQVGDSDPESFTDAVLLDVLCPPAVEADKPMTITAAGIFRGLSNQKCKIVCAIDNKHAVTIDYHPESSNHGFREDIEIVHDLRPGFHRLSVSLESLQLDVSPQNNRLDVLFKVKEHGIRILYLDSVIRPEFKFLKRLLTTNEGFSATVKSPFWLRTRAGRQYLQTLDFRDYDIFIIGDVERAMIGEEGWTAMQTLVRNRGAALWVIGGTYTLAPSFWASNPIAECLPVRLQREFRVVEPFTMRPNVKQQSHFVISELGGLSPQPTEWDKLPLNGLRNYSIRSRPSSTILLQDQNDLPLLSLGNYYRGRTAIWLTDCSWSWRLHDASPPNLHNHIWTRLLYWLAAREDSLNANLSIVLGASTFRADEELIVSGDMMDDKNVPIAEAGIELQVLPLSDDEAGASKTVPMLPESGRYLGRLNRLPTGEYRLQAKSEWQGKTIVSNELRVSIQEPRLEIEDVRVDGEQLKAIAERTGGTFRQLDDLGRLLNALPQNAKVVRVRRVESSTPLWDRMWVLALAVCLLGAEWVGRRRLGLL